MTSYLGRLTGCLVASGILLAISVAGDESAAFTTLAALFPLIYYHVFFLRRKAQSGLSQAEIDSVYYFGFLVTLGSLAASAFKLHLGGAQGNVAAIAYQFGLGLIATGYAVYARLHLAAIAASADSANLEAEMLEIVQRSHQLGLNVEAAIQKFQDLASVVTHKTAESADAARARAEESMLSAAAVFQNAMREATDDSKANIKEIRASLAELEFSAERRKLAKAVDSTIKILHDLGEGLRGFTDSATGASTEALRLHESLGSLERGATMTRNEIERLGGSSGPISRAGTAITEATEAMSKVSPSMTDASASFAAASDALSRAVPRFEQLSGFSNAGESLAAAGERMAASVGHMDAIALSLSRLDAALDPLEHRVQALTGGFAKIQESSVIAASVVGGLLDHANLIAEHGQRLSATIGRAADAAIQVGERSVEMASIVSKSQPSVESLNQFVRGVGELTSSGDVMVGLTKELAASIERLGTSVAAASDGLKRTIGESASRLESDVERSSLAASLLTAKLIEAAQSIIDSVGPERRR